MSKPKSFVTRILAEGTTFDQKIVRDELNEQTMKLVKEMPVFGPDKLIYIRNLVTKSLRGEIDKEVVKRFIRITNSWEELESCSARIALLVNREKGG